MQYKRLTLFAGHYGSGKTNLALNYARWLKRQGLPVTIADLDIVNPYFRTKDSAQELREAKIRLICSEYANTNLDIPALPQDLYAITDDPGLCAVVDVGGDDRGALALGRIAPALAKENNYEMLLVINAYRPLTRGAADVLQIKEEIEFSLDIFPTTMKSVIGSKSWVNNKTVLFNREICCIPMFLNILCKMAYFLLLSNDETGSSNIIKSAFCICA